jgi:hypothetical protein
VVRAAQARARRSPKEGGLDSVHHVEHHARYWTFQLLEAGILLAFAATLLAAGIWWLRTHQR